MLVQTMGKNLLTTGNVQAYLKTVEMFTGLSDDEIDAISHLGQVVAYEAGEVIFDEDSQGTELYITPYGSISVDLSLPGEAVSESIYQVKHHEIFGELALVDGYRRSATTRAREDCQMLVFQRADLFALMDANPHMGYIIMRNLAHILARKLRQTNLAMRNGLAQSRQLSSALLRDAFMS